ncbi:Hypothetical Protein FCC1311_096862 [Hondaea fermentalgiana]|uniref:Uncharacterized protein n=1 Tax=Hondaea fermentalgiana TaxID=2315210 RepID=A0A2R5GXN6_9STRA|nr:Hypothetical Protein FCC1311_096862 [Hondaea fermentalgiana]|eukprot:GBG33463.1 Hypothetical Protein FCC1311_096862 [Hondaea fermentalgiana]
MLARIVAIVDARALDLDVERMELRLSNLLLATSILFAAATTALFSDALEVPTPESYEKIYQDVVAGAELYAKNGVTPGTFSQREIDRAITTLATTNGDYSSPFWEADTITHFLLRYYETTGSALIDSYTYLMSATLFTVTSYLAVGLIRSHFKKAPEPADEDDDEKPVSQSRFPLNIFFYVQAYGLFFAVYAFVYGTVQLTYFARYRFMFTFSSGRAQYQRMLLQDFFDPFVSGADLQELGALVSTLVVLLLSALFVNIVEAFTDRRSVEEMYVGAGHSQEDKGKRDPTDKVQFVTHP